MSRQYHADQVKHVAVSQPGPGNLWVWASDGSQWVYFSAVINILPRSGNINTTIQTPDGEVVPVTMSRSGHLFAVEDGWLNSGVPLIRCVSTETFPKRVSQ